MEELQRIAANHFLLDGEIAAFDEQGKSSFQLLQARINRRSRSTIQQVRMEVPAVYMVFDLLACEGYDLRSATLEERRRILKALLPSSQIIRQVDVLHEHGREFYQLVQQQNLEGVVAKDADSKYFSKRTPAWRKVKSTHTERFVIGGFTAPSGSRQYFGSLLVGRFGGDKLIYAGRVGTGFDEARLKRIHTRLEGIQTDQCPFKTIPKEVEDSLWVKPELVCQVRFNEWTRDGILRAPSFQGMLPSADPAECAADVQPQASPPPEEIENTDPPQNELEQYPFLSNLDKVFWPEKGYLKRDLVSYYHEIAPVILPYLIDRPMNMERYPDGWEGKSFYQKDAPGFLPEWIATAPVESDSKGKVNHYVLCNDRATLVYLANLACIPLHPWSSRVQSIDCPDFLIIDLDPDPAIPFSEVCRFAQKVRQVLESLELKCFPKTSGSKGLHVLAPLQAEYDYQMVRSFGEIVARLAVRGMEDLATFERSMTRRKGKIYVDYLQNGKGKTIVSPYCIRPRAGAPVSTPLEWGEVGPGIRPESLHIKNIFRRLERKGDLFEGVLTEKQSLAEALVKLESVLQDHNHNSPG